MDDDTNPPRSGPEVSARRFAAAISGAIEGFLEGIEEYDLEQEAQAGLQAAGDVAREAGAEAQTLAHTPEMRDIADAVGRATDTVKAKAHGAREKADEVKQGAKVRAQAVAETGRRARQAPRLIVRDLRKAMGAWWNGIIVAAGMAVAMATLAIVTLIVLTIALVVALDRALGDPAGTFVVAAIYFVATLVAYGVMKSGRATARTEARRRIEDAKEDARHVTAPVRSAFGRGPRTPGA